MCLCRATVDALQQLNKIYTTKPSTTEQFHVYFLCNSIITIHLFANGEFQEDALVLCPCPMQKAEKTRHCNHDPRCNNQGKKKKKVRITKGCICRKTNEKKESFSTWGFCHSLQ